MMASDVDTTNSSASRLVEVSWIPPSNSELNFTSTRPRCRRATDWRAAFYLAHEERTLEAALPFGTTIDYLRAILPDNMTQPTPAQLTIWYAKLASGHDPDANATFARLLDFPLRECKLLICGKLGWEGDPDVSGVGMLMSYYLLAGFATIYVAIIAWINYGLRRNKDWEVPWFADAFRESVGGFILAAVIFAASMLAAGVVRYVYYGAHPRDHQSLYALMGSVFMATFSVLPVLVLQSVADGPRRQYVVQFLWLVIIALAIALEVLYRQLFHEQSWDTARRGDPEGPNWGGIVRQNTQALETAWLDNCDPGWLRFRVEDTLTAAHVLLALNGVWFLYYVVWSVVPDGLRERMRSKEPIATWWPRCKVALRAINGILCGVLMWTLLIVFQTYRDKVRELAGPSYQDTKWTFGQMLALATFAPVAVELVAIMAYGPEWGLSGTLSKRYRVVENGGDHLRGRATI